MGSAATSSATCSNDPRTTSCRTSRSGSICGSRPEAPPLREDDGILDRLGIGHRIDHLPDELSGGEQQRAAFAQAVVAGSAVVVADEPTAELDSESGQLVMDGVRALVDAGVTFVVATHDGAVRSSPMK